MIKTLPSLGEISQAFRPNSKASALTHHCSIFLTLDRTLSPAGERRLKDLRCLGRGADFAWPSPGVFNIPKFALKICNNLAQTRRAPAPFPTLKFEELLLELWLSQGELSLSQGQDYSLASFERELKIALRFAPLGLSGEELGTIFREIESGVHAAKDDSGELSLWGERIFLYVKALGWAVENKQSLTPWDAVYRVAHLTDLSELQTLPWLALLERHPFESKLSDISFVVPETQSPQPLERAFLEKLSQIFPVNKVMHPYVPTEDSFFLSNLEVKNEFKNIESPDDACLAWAFDSEAAGPVEALCALPSNFPVDLSLKTWEDDNETLRVLSLYLSHLDEPLNSQHAFHRFKRESSFLKSWGLNSESNPSPSAVLEAWFEKTDPELKISLIEKLKKLSYSQLSQVFLFFSRSTLFRVEREALQHTRLSAKGIPLLTLPDLALGGSNEFLLWGSPKDFEKHLAPQSSPVLKSQEWPFSLKKVFDAHGLILPDPQTEQELLLGSFQALAPHLKLILPPTPLRINNSAAPIWKEPALLARSSISPSALESYAECSFKYYIDRVLRPERIEDWDPVPLNPMDMGIWVHAVLEKFLNSNNWNQLGTKLRELLNIERENVFQAPHSPAYKNILRQEGDLLFEKLREHLLRFEAPLLKLMGNRKELLAEVKLKGDFLGRSYNGKIDRLDSYETGIHLLWDYKTGRIDGKAATQIRNNKFQWFLYRQLLQDRAFRETKFPISGGGYLNPLDSNKSNLFLYPHLLPDVLTEGLVALAKENGHSIELIDSSGEEEVNQGLSNKLQGLNQLMEDGYISPTGDIVKHCSRCSSRALCGKTYLEGEPESVSQ